MIGRGVPERLKRRTKRGAEAIELNRAALDRSTEAVERAMAALERHEQMADEYKIFIRDMNRRNERIVQDLVRHDREIGARHAQRTAAIIAQLEELTKESRAQREGLLAAIDRLPPALGS